MFQVSSFQGITFDFLRNMHIVQLVFMQNQVFVPDFKKENICDTNTTALFLINNKHIDYINNKLCCIIFYSRSPASLFFFYDINVFLNFGNLAWLLHGY